MNAVKLIKSSFNKTPERLNAVNVILATSKLIFRVIDSVVLVAGDN